MEDIVMDFYKELLFFQHYVQDVGAKIEYYYPVKKHIVDTLINHYRMNRYVPNQVTALAFSVLAEMQVYYWCLHDYNLIHKLKMLFCSIKFCNDAKLFRYIIEIKRKLDYEEIIRPNHSDEKVVSIYDYR